ncbi:MAG: hypothetical protein JWO67_1329 [Streptosporangiaceae bacterium]|nr:hypothetical protein [Streptosporangiaceae bacterium]
MADYRLVFDTRSGVVEQMVSAELAHADDGGQVVFTDAEHKLIANVPAGAPLLLVQRIEEAAQ